MLSSLPCFYAFCWSAIPTSCYIFNVFFFFSSGLSSAGSALVESSNCKIFCSQQGHCDRHIVCHIPGAARTEVQFIPLHQGCWYCYCLINTLQLHSQIKMKAPPKPLQAEHSSNSDIWLLAWTLPICHEQWWVLKLQGYAKYLQHCIRPLIFSDLSAFLSCKEGNKLCGLINAVLQGIFQGDQMLCWWKSLVGKRIEYISWLTVAKGFNKGNSLCAARNLNPCGHHR